VPLEVALVAKPGSDGSSSVLTPGEQYEAIRKKSRECSGTATDGELVSFVRGSLFSKFKFFMDPKQLEFSNDKTTICHTIWKSMGQTEDTAREWWENSKETVSKTLNLKRNDASAAIKEKFLGKTSAGRIEGRFIACFLTFVKHYTTRRNGDTRRK
jgi:hypothetical protein